MTDDLGNYKPMIRTYVGDEFFVVSQYRECSSPYACGHWYWETHVYDFKVSKGPDKLLATFARLDAHWDAVTALVEDGEKGLSRLLEKPFI